MQFEFGWAGRALEDETLEKIGSLLIPFRIVAKGTPRDNSKVRLMLPDFVKKITGEYLRNIPQPEGDCTSRGATNAIDHLQAYEIAQLGQDEKFTPTYSPFVYSLSRLAKDLGHGMFGRGHGCTGGYAALAAQRYGAIAWGDRAYNSQTVNQYAFKLPPQAEITEGELHQVRGIAQITSFEQARDAIANGYPVTIASNKGYQMRLKDRGGKSWFVGNDTWPHQMALVAVDYEPEPCLLDLNSWGCFDEATEILTDLGWFRFADLPVESRVCTLNPRTHVIEYQYPTARQKYEVNTSLCKFSGEGVDLLVTNNHRMYMGDTKKGKENPQNWVIQNADSVTQSYAMCKNGQNMNSDVDSYMVGTKSVPMDIWLEFLGYFISEGYTGTNRVPITRYSTEKTREFVKSRGGSCPTSWKSNRQQWGVGVTQKKPQNLETFRRCLEKLPFKFSRSSRAGSWTTHSKELASELRVFGKSPVRYLPSYVFDVSQRQARILLDALTLGDGHKKELGEGTKWTYYTSSKRLADDVQRLAIHAGYGADIYEIDRIGRVNAKGVTRHLEYHVTIKRVRTKSVHAGGWRPLLIPYVGNVYCVTVPNGIVMVRRNGKQVWSGNSDAHGPQLDGPNGSGWITADQFMQMLRNDGEAYAYSDGEGFPEKPLIWF